VLDAAGRRIEQITGRIWALLWRRRLNAAGRLTDMSIGIACLLADQPAEAARLAATLDKLNEERREIEQRMQLEAIDIAAGVRFGDDGGEALGLCLFDERWHQGGGGPGRRQDQRPVESTGHRLCARRGRLAARLRPLDSGSQHSRRTDSIAAHHPVSSTNSAATPWRPAMSMSEGARDDCDAVERPAVARLSARFP